MKKLIGISLVFALAIIGQSFLTVDPTSPTKGFGWFNNTSARQKIYDGTTVQTLAWLTEVTGGLAHASFLSFAGTGTATFAPQAGAGSGATAVCSGAHVCDSISGEITLTSGTVPATGTQLIITLPGSRTNRVNCAVDIYGGIVFLGISKTTLTNSITISAGVALASATAYQISYVCGSN